MIEQALREHLLEQEDLEPYLTRYADQLAIFNQEAPSDADEAWDEGPQYGRIVFVVDLEGDPERTMGGTLAVDIMCHEEFGEPEVIEPIVRHLIHGYFFSNGTFTVAAQWKNSSYFKQPTDKVIGCTMTFELLGFPIITTHTPDLVRRINEWTSEHLRGVHVINHDELPSAAWKPEGRESAVYWRFLTDKPAGWIPDTFQTIWRTAIMKCHVFSENPATAADTSREIVLRLHAAKRLVKEGETQIMVNRGGNDVDIGADPLRTGQVTVQATYGVIVHLEPDGTIQHINY